jgi:hypothetical protein
LDDDDANDVVAFGSKPSKGCPRTAAIIKKSANATAAVFVNL